MSIVDIRLILHIGIETITINFGFDTERDNIDETVAELASQMSIKGTPVPPDMIPLIKKDIEEQIRKTSPSSNASINIPTSHSITNLNSDSSDSDLSDPEYKALIDKQDREMQELLAHHLQEKKELATRIAAQQTALQDTQLMSAPNPSVVTTNSTSNAANQPCTCDDLIVF